MGELDGQVAIVTGAASGIGSAIVEAYLEEGARVLLADRDERALVAAAERYAAAGGLVSASPVDVSNPEQTRTMADECVDTFGHVDILTHTGTGCLQYVRRSVVPRRVAVRRSQISAFSGTRAQLVRRPGDAA